MGELTVVQELVYNRKRLLSLVEFHKSLRRFGMKAKSLIDDTKYHVPDQFVAAAIVSYSEIENVNTGIIDKAEEILFEYERRDKTIEVLDCHLSFDRLVILFNLEKPLLTHGEARLFDYDGQIRHTTCTLKFFKNHERKRAINFLKTLKKQFYESFPKDEKYLILIFSHYIPCTTPNHMCSRLLYEFARRKKEQLIISYFAVSGVTHPEIAWQYMRKSPYIYCIHPKDAQFGPKTFPQPDIEEKIEFQIDYNEVSIDQFIKPHCARVIRGLSKLEPRFKKTGMKYQRKGDRIETLFDILCM